MSFPLNYAVAEKMPPQISLKCRQVYVFFFFFFFFFFNFLPLEDMTRQIYKFRPIPISSVVD